MSKRLLPKPKFDPTTKEIPLHSLMKVISESMKLIFATFFPKTVFLKLK